jgi:hypothetical protein
MSPEFTQRIGTRPVALSVFQDQHGSWAKRWSDVTSVRVVFDDETTTYLTPAEFRGLSKSHKEVIYRAPSSVNLMAHPDAPIPPESWP